MTLAIDKSVGMNITPCGNDMESKWDAFVSVNGDATIFHKYAWKKIFENAYGNECIYLMAEKDGVTVGVLPLVSKRSRLFGNFFVSLPYFDHAGICCKDSDVREMLFERAQQLARERNADYIELRHDRDQGLDLVTRQSKVSMNLELPQDPDQLWSDLKAKVRNQVRKAEKEDLSVDEGGEQFLNDFFGVYAANMRDLGSPSHSKNFFRQICRTYPEAVRIYCVKIGKKTIAAGFTIASKNTLTIPWASSLRQFNAKCPNMLLYWSILKSACESGFSQFSFGRSTPDQGTHKFKKQWGATPKQLYWQYWLGNGSGMPALNMENSKYQLPIRLWKAMPVTVTRTLGPKIIQNLS